MEKKNLLQYGGITWSYDSACFQYHVRKSTKTEEIQFSHRPHPLLFGYTTEIEENCLAEVRGKSWLFFSFLFSRHKLTFFFSLFIYLLLLLASTISRAGLWVSHLSAWSWTINSISPSLHFKYSFIPLFNQEQGLLLILFFVCDEITSPFGVTTKICLCSGKSKCTTFFLKECQNNGNITEKKKKKRSLSKLSLQAAASQTCWLLFSGKCVQPVRPTFHCFIDVPRVWEPQIWFCESCH